MIWSYGVRDRPMIKLDEGRAHRPVAVPLGQDRKDVASVAGAHGRQAHNAVRAGRRLRQGPAEIPLYGLKPLDQ